MSTSRYPKRRRVSGRDKDATPPPPPPSLPAKAEHKHYDSSPDELAPSSDHEKFLPSRTNSRPTRPKRNASHRKKSLTEDVYNATAAAAISEADPNELTLTTAPPEASDDELSAAAAAAATYAEGQREGSAASSCRIGDDHPESENTAVPAPAEDNLAKNEEDEGQSMDEIPDERNALAADLIEDIPDQQTIVSEPSVEEHVQLEVPNFFRRSSTFRGSFSKDVTRESEDRYLSRSPPPYSRLSTPIATPREPLIAPPQYVSYKQKMVLKGHKRGVAAVQFSPNGRLIASCSADATIRIWDARTGKHLHTLEGHLAGISTLAWSPDSKTLASGSDDKSIRLWDVSTGKAHTRPLISHSSYVYALAFSPRGNMLASGSFDEALFLWDVRTSRLMRSHPAHSDPIGGVDFVRDGTLIVSCAGDGLIRVWDTATGQCLRTLVHEDNAAVTGVRFSPNGKFILAWTLDSSIRLWNYVEGRCVKTYQGHQNEKYSINGTFGVFANEDDSQQRAFVVSGSEDGRIFTWDVQSKEILQTMEGHEGVVLGVDTWNEGGFMVSCGLDRTVRVWERSREPSKEEETAESSTMNGGTEEVTMTKDEAGAGEEEAAMNGEGGDSQETVALTEGTADEAGAGEEAAAMNGEGGDSQATVALTAGTADEIMVNGVEA